MRSFETNGYDDRNDSRETRLANIADTLRYMYLRVDTSAASSSLKDASHYRYYTYVRYAICTAYLYAPNIDVPFPKLNHQINH